MRVLSYNIHKGIGGRDRLYRIERIIRVIAEQEPDLRIALTAPTGKAAARLQESVREAQAQEWYADADRARLAGLGATTLHRLLGWRPGSTSRFRHHRGNRLPHDVIVAMNDELAALSVRHPGRIHGLASVDAYDGERSAREAERAIRRRVVELRRVDQAADALPVPLRGLVDDPHGAQPVPALAPQRPGVVEAPPFFAFGGRQPGAVVAAEVVAVADDEHVHASPPPDLVGHAAVGPDQPDDERPGAEGAKSGSEPDGELLESPD